MKYLAILTIKNLLTVILTIDNTSMSFLLRFVARPVSWFTADPCRDGTKHYGNIHFYPNSRSVYTTIGLMDLMVLTPMVKLIE